MSYLTANLLAYLLVAFAIGLMTGWYACGARDARK